MRHKPAFFSRPGDDAVLECRQVESAVVEVCQNSELPLVKGVVYTSDSIDSTMERDSKM